jgi:hypothetical protein
MRTKLLLALIAGLLVSAAGCGRPTRIIGHGIQQPVQLFGDVGITGNNNDFTVLAGSRVTKLSIIGDDNRITVEEGVALNRVEFFGNGNTLSVPDFLVIRTAQVGTNQIIRRPREPRPADDWIPPAEATPADTFLEDAYEPPPTAEPVAPPAEDVIIIEEPPTTEPEYEPSEDEPEFRPPPTVEPVEPPAPAENNTELPK